MDKRSSSSIHYRSGESDEQVKQKVEDAAESVKNKAKEKASIAAETARDAVSSGGMFGIALFDCSRRHADRLVKYRSACLFDIPLLAVCTHNAIFHLYVYHGAVRCS